MAPKPRLLTLMARPQVEDHRPLLFRPSPASENITATDSTLVHHSRPATATTPNPHVFEPLMSSNDAYLFSTTRLNVESEESRNNRSRLIASKLGQTSPDASAGTENPRVMSSRSADRRSILDMDSYLPLPEQSRYIGANPIKSRRDLEIHRSTIEAYERHASASTRSTAVHCLREASFFKTKSWLKQVELSKEMVKHQVHRRIHQATALPLRATAPNITVTSTTIPVQ